MCVYVNYIYTYNVLYKFQDFLVWWLFVTAGLVCPCFHPLRLFYPPLFRQTQFEQK